MTDFWPRQKKNHAEADDLLRSVDNLLSKTNLLMFLVSGLRRLGKTTLASTLELMRPDML
jgi:predicted AAA+ superfamily ATPase